MSDVLTRNRATASVFVTTYNTLITDGEETEIGKWFNLKDFADHEEFMAAAMAYAQTEIGEENPDVMFPHEKTSFDSHHFIGTQRVREDIWDLLALSDEDIALVEAYQMAFDKWKTSVDCLLEQAKELFIGKFESDVDFAMHLFADKAKSLPMPFCSNIDWQGVAVDVAAQYFVYNNHYFQPYQP